MKRFLKCSEDPGVSDTNYKATLMPWFLKCSEDLGVSDTNYNATLMPWFNISPTELLIGSLNEDTDGYKVPGQVTDPAHTPR